MGDFEAIYRKHFNAVFRYALQTAGKRHVAEDITSDAFLRLYHNLSRIDETQLPAWLFTVVKNRAIDHWRKFEVEQRYLDGIQISTSQSTNFEVDPVLRSPALKPAHRVCLILRYNHGMTLPEISAKTGLTETQVKGFLQYGRELLRKELLQKPK